MNNETKRAEAPDDLIAEIKTRLRNAKQYLGETQNTTHALAELLADILKSREGKVIDEFVERVKGRIGHQPEYGKDRWGEGISEVVRSMESAAEEMKRK